MFDTTVKIPALLHVYKESRTEGLRFYQLNRTNKFAMNTFYLSPDQDILSLVQPRYDQIPLFFQEDDCGLLSKVQNIATRNVNDDLATYLYGSSIKEITIITKEHCQGRRYMVARDTGCVCKLRNFIDFAGLADDENDILVDSRSVEAVFFKRKWQALGDLPCPSVRSLAICGKSRNYWQRINNDDIEAIRARKLELESDSGDRLAATLESGKILEAEFGEGDLKEVA